jgi:DNA repair exonuclease SbcCD nuclease subunit
MKFAHLADIHVGAWRDEKLKEINLQTFEKAMDDIFARKVDFIIISGDIFHVNVPDLDSVKRVVLKFQGARELEIPIYVVYGSHDYSPNSTSIIDILVAGGLLIRVMDAYIEDDMVKLRCVTDEKTGVKLCGISGRSYSMERDYYEILDRESLEKWEGFRIFVLHSAINEIKPSSSAYDTGVQRSYLPKGFDYYAGGHVHEYLQDESPDYGKIGYPGALFGSSFSDLENVANGMKRGYIVVEFENAVKKIEFIETTYPKIEFHHIKGDNKTSRELSSTIKDLIDEVKPKDKIILLKVDGTLSQGLVTDIDWNELRDKLTEKGSEFASINRRGLTTKEVPEIRVQGESVKEIESNILLESLKDFAIPRSYSDETRKWVENEFKGSKGLELASKLLEVLKTEKQEGETNTDFEERVSKDIYQILPRRSLK